MDLELKLKYKVSNPLLGKVVKIILSSLKNFSLAIFHSASLKKRTFSDIYVLLVLAMK